MTERTKRIRAVVEALRKLEESDWDIIDKIFNSKKILILANYDEKENKVDKLLRDLGIPLHVLGYEYIKSAIYFVLENKNRMLFITRDINPYVAEKFNTTPSRVERSMRSAINTAWKNGNIKTHYEVFGYSINENPIKPQNFEAIKAISKFVETKIF